MRCTKTFALAAAVAACLALSSSGVMAKTTIRVSHTQIETHPHHLACEKFKEIIEQKMGDKYDVQIFSNSSLGANEKVMELVKMGVVPFLVISTNNIENFDKTYGVFNIPYVFASENSYNHYILDPQVLEKLGAKAKDDGFVPMAIYTAGSRNFYAKAKLESVDDLKGKKFRVMAGPTNVAMMNAFGAAAAPMSFGEVYSALQQGVVDGAENNELAITDQKHGEVCKYYIYDGHQMCPDLLVGSYKFLDGLPAEDRQVFEEAAAESQKVATDKWNARVAEAVEQGKAMGVNYIKVDTKPFRDKVLPLHQELLKEAPQMQELYDLATSYNEKYPN